MKKTDLPTFVGFGVMAVFLFCVSATISVRSNPLPNPNPRDPNLLRKADSLPRELVALRDALAPERLVGQSDSETRAAAAAWFEAAAARGLSSREAFALVMPDNDFYTAHLADRDTKDEIVNLAEGDTPIARRYALVAARIPNAELVAARAEAIAETYWKLDDRAAMPASAHAAPLERRLARVPTKRELWYAHQDALDVFFYDVERAGDEEIGPEIRSMTDGVVVASSDDWVGDETPEGYVSGGISPRRGDGVIVYDPRDRCYYVYIHFSSVGAPLGTVVRAGDLLGRGGNTGINARKPYHGEHVHLEIYDAARNLWFSAAKIRSFVLALF